MTEREICLSYREAKKRNTQLQILAELNGTSRARIIGILLKNGEKVSNGAINKLYKRLEVLEDKISDLEAQISDKEREYREIVQALNGGEAIDG